MKQSALDVCCGSKMMWFDKKDQRAAFNDIRSESHTLCDGRELIIEPDFQYDFTNLRFENEQFNLVVFDPPHLINAGKNSWLAKKYGVLGKNWKKDIKAGFKECFRVLKTDGTLIFKWNENQILTSEILKLTDEKPLFGHKSGKRSGTHWLVFMKTADGWEDR